jgi:hypothetical protein
LSDPAVLFLPVPLFPLDLFQEGIHGTFAFGFRQRGRGGGPRSASGRVRVGRGRRGAGRDRSGGYISFTGSIRAYNNGSTGMLAACPAVHVGQTNNHRLTSSGLDEPPTYTSSASSVSRTSSPAPRCRGRIVSGEKVFKLFIRLGRVSSGRGRGARGGRTRRMSSIKFSSKSRSLGEP